jgi:hypothetical protein
LDFFFLGLGSCSCTDCEESCAPPDFTPYQKQEFAKSGNIDYWQMIVIIIFASGILVGFILFLFKNHIFVKPNVVHVEECASKHNSQDQQVPVSNSNFKFRSLKLDFCLQTNFHPFRTSPFLSDSLKKNPQSEII